MVPRALLAACAAALLACDGGAPRPVAERSAASPGSASPDAEGPGNRAPGPRGDRHARAAARRAPRVRRVDGTIARTGERRVVIDRRGAPALTLRVGPDAAVTLDGRPARLEDVPEGAEVRAAYRAGAYGRPTALSLEVRSGRATAPGRPARR